MKNLLLTCFSFILMIGVLVGCSNEEAATPKEEIENRIETKKDTLKQDSEEAEADKEEKQVAEEKPETNADVANAIDFTEALDPNKPVPFGEYMKVSIYSVESRKHHTVYIKFNKVTSESDDAEYVQKVINENNAEGYDFEVIDRDALNLPDDLELNVIDYELVIPEEFPAPDYGLTGVRASFFAKSIEGGGTPSNDGNLVYLGLGAVEELLTEGFREQKFMPGNAYSLRAYYAMVKDFDDYVIEILSFPDGSDGSNDMKAAYFAIK